MNSEVDIKKRSIRSFVMRGGRVTPAQKLAIDSYWSLYGIDISDHEIDYAHGFDAIKLEIGIGNGDALISMASADPTSLYIGVEVHQPGIGRCLNNIHLQQLKNVRLISQDAIEVLEKMIAAGSLDCVFLFFPDPWHKKRHHKRRIVNAHFRNLIDRALKPGGRFHAATDWQDYAEHMLEELSGDDRFSSCGNATGYCDTPEYRPLTKFEQRGRRLGHGVWDLIYEKLPQ